MYAGFRGETSKKAAPGEESLFGRELIYEYRLRLELAEELVDFFRYPGVLPTAVIVVV